MGHKTDMLNYVESIWIHGRLTPEQMTGFSVMDRLYLKAGTSENSFMDSYPHNFSGHGGTTKP